ncbi:hypothetical protein DDB_G0274175 [Dictyostelium discoideum AX4]|uniref:RETREG1-3/ARL6IP-like N-terminal reticulon-homology domain-containing protein n=1 Tax=Dictyostelium discoideum TaxID=44689 RepID=Q86KC3_DICDI|nr:hypothetical protein DDB_G0274175 [Dictyostelium discoideum AX4]EAL69980.1 hypothetical protein DDB_G0274175 [Dictyostelium discoideum AX4]|eukprot:XP_644287.1 hypothetical protein DDB_G0274175 [Dictyostelium discoideum AX4]
MSSILHKKAQFKKQLEDTFKDHQDLVKYSKNVLLLNRPIDFGVLFILVSFILYYFKNFNTSALSFFSFFISFILILHTIILNFNLKSITRVIPTQDSKDSYEDIINLIVKVKFAFSDSLSELNRFRHVNPTKFNIQTSIVLGVLGFIGIFFSGYTIIVLVVYSTLLLPYILYGKKPQNTGQQSQDLLNNIIVVMKPIIENIIKISQQLFTQILDLATNKKQPSPGIPNQNYSNNNTNNNNNNNTNTNNNNNNGFVNLNKVDDTINKNLNSIGNNINSIGSNISNKISQQINNHHQQQEDEQQEEVFYDESNFTKTNNGYVNQSNPILKKRF